MLFDGIITNIGEFYNPDTSVFICPYDGIYMFNVVLQSTNGYYIRAFITKQGTRLVEAYSDNNNADQGSTTVVTECQSFDSVWVECSLSGSQIIGTKQSSFTGVLLSAYS